jgi:hypothetical protein
MTVSNSVMRGGGRNRGAVSAGGDEIPPPLFSLARGSAHHLHIAAARAGVDHFWLTGTRDEVGYGETTDSNIFHGLDEGCFNAPPVSHNVVSAQQSNKRDFYSRKSDLPP